MSNKWISVEREFLSNLIDNTRMLQGEWRWKENSSKSNNRDMKAIADDIEKGDKLLEEGNVSKEPIEDELLQRFMKVLPMGMPSVVTNSVRIAKQYANSKLQEIEKWCDEQFNHADSLDKQCDNTRYFGGKKDAFSLMKIKLQSLKQES